MRPSIHRAKLPLLIDGAVRPRLHVHADFPGFQRRCELLRIDPRENDRFHCLSCLAAYRLAAPGNSLPTDRRNRNDANRYTAMARVPSTIMWIRLPGTAIACASWFWLRAIALSPLENLEVVLLPDTVR
jgi:hypothetical protein